MITELIFGFFYLFADFVYWLKYAATVIALQKRKYTQRKRFDLYDYEVENQPEKLGIIVPKEERLLEAPFSEEHLEKAADEVFFYGVNSKSEALLLRVSRHPDDTSEAWIYLKLADGREYQLEQTKGYQSNFDGKCTSFTCGGLKIHNLCPMRRWRITYCGMLSEGNTENGKEIFVKFTLIWTASSEVYDASWDMDVTSTADAISQAEWDSVFPPVDKAATVLNYYSQSGIINGIVSIENEPDTEIYMFGGRIRNLGELVNLEGSKFKLILGVIPETGLYVHLQKASVPNTFHNLYFGFIVHPNSEVININEAYIMSNLSEKDKTEQNLTAMFKAGKRYELKGHFSGDTLHFSREQGWNGPIEIKRINFEVDTFKGSGFMISGEILKVPETFRKKSIQKITPPLSTNIPLTVKFTDEMSHFTDITGGKGSSLGKLTKLNNEMKSEFIVPSGIIVTTAAYSEFLTTDIKEKIENLKNIVYGIVKGDINEACKIVQSAIKCANLPEKIMKDIETDLHVVFRGCINERRFAVRSSATGEDTDLMSAAGQMDTFLGIQGLTEIFIAVKKCWASQFGYVAVEYKRQNGQILNTPMAVVIQEMAECESSGVLFTCDPVTNNPSVVVITGNYGLGESVVSGSEEPDTIVLRKLPEENVEVKSIILGLKEHRIVMADTNMSEAESTVTEAVPEDKRNKCCISEEMAVKLGKLALKIEEYFKSARDIEWGIKNNIIYVLQSRPVTTGGSISDYEIMHELDGPMRCEGDYITSCNVGEVMPGAMSPLGLDVLIRSFSTIFMKKRMKVLQNGKFQQTKYFHIGMVPFYRHLLMGVTDLLCRADDYESLMTKSVMIGIFGRILDDPDMIKKAEYRKSGSTNEKSIFSLVYFFKNLFFAGHGIESVKRKVFNYPIPAESGRTSKEAFRILLHTFSHVTETMEIHMNCSTTSAMWNMYMFTVLASTQGCIDNDVYSDFAKLLASSTKVESADVPSAMEDLAQLIIKDITSEEFKEMSVEEAQKWLETSDTLAGKTYRQFLQRHGHRCINELDIYSISWSIDPKPLIKLLQGMCGCSDGAKQKEEENLSSILPRLTIQHNLKSRMLLKIILPNCRTGIRNRESCKSNMVKAMDNVRRGFIHLSKMMVAEGYLPQQDLIFFLTIDEINDLLETRNPRLIARAKLRKHTHPVLYALKFPDITKGRPVPINDEAPIEYIADLTMKGIPVSQGMVKGYARVAPSLKEAAELKPGEILITHSTDIAWSPYFPILGGVVTELGGLISHGAVVSREYGLPCVVGLPGVTKQFLTGDYVLLDGNKGILQRLSSPENR